MGMSKQEAWDDILIRGWFFDLPMGIAANHLIANGYAVEGNDIIGLFDDLLRAPVCLNHITRMSCRTFMSASMPWLNSFLWDYPDTDIDKFIKKISASLYSIEKKSAAVNAAIYAKRKAERDVKRDVPILKGVTSENDWKVVSPVRRSGSHSRHKK